MRFTVTCHCVASPVADCPNEDDAKAVARRHDMLNKNHNAQVERVLETPFEGLVS